MNEKLIKQLEQIQQWLSQKNNDLNGFIDWDSTNPNVIADPEWTRLTKIQEDLLAIDQRIIQVSNKKSLGLNPLRLDQKKAPMGITAPPSAAKEQEIAPSETTLEPPNPLEMLASNNETMGLVEEDAEAEDNGEPGIINIGNIESIKSESGVDKIIAVLGVTPHETNAPAYLVDAINTFIAGMRLSATTGYIALIAANAKSWEKSDYRMLVALNGRDLSLGTPFKSELWKDCEQSIGETKYNNLTTAEFYFTEELKISGTKEHTHKILITSNDSGYQQSFTFPTSLIENYGEPFLETPKFQDKARLSIQTKNYGSKNYLLVKDLAPTRVYYISTFDGNDKPILVNSVLKGIKGGQYFIVRITKTKDMVENPSANELLNEQLSNVFTEKDTPNNVEGNIAEINAIGFGFSIKANKEVVKGGKGFEAYVIATRGGQPTSVNVSIKKNTALFSFEPSLWINAIGDVYISSIEYDFISKNIDIERSKNYISGNAIDSNFKNFFSKIFNGIDIEKIFEEHEFREISSQIQYNFLKYTQGSSTDKEDEGKNNNMLAEGISFNGNIVIKKNVLVKIGSWGGIILKSGAVVGANIDLAASIDKIIECPEQAKINKLSIDTSDMYLVNDKGGIEAIFKGIAIEYGGEISVDILIQNKKYKRIKLYEAIVKAAGEALFKSAITTGKPLVLPNGSPITKSAEFVQAAMETEILDGISRFAIEQILRVLLIQNIKTANPSFSQYGIDIEKALGL